MMEDQSDCEENHGGTTKEMQEHFSVPQFKDLVHSKDDSLTSIDIQEMEKVRLSLQSMLKSSEHFLRHDKVTPGDTTTQGFPQVMSSGVDNESFTSIGTTDLLNNFATSEKETVGGMVDLTPLEEHSGETTRQRRYKYDKSLLVENSLLNDSLEKERLKRKHCEQQIKELQTKLLETMQELAVSVSGERKKDVMINQLDKTLARVVDDWKKHEHEKITALNKLEEQRTQDDQSQQRQQEMLTQFEKDLSQAVEALATEQERAAMAEHAKDSQINEITQDRDQLLALLEQESQNVTVLKKNMEELHERNERDGTSISMLNQEKQSWQDERSELEAKIDMIRKAHTEDVENERKLVEHEKQVAEDSQRVLNAVQKEVQLLTVQLDTSNREKENLKTEITLLTAKFEAQKTRQDGEHQAHLENQLDKHLQEAQEQMRKKEHEMRAAHKKQIEELTKKFRNDLENQLRTFHEQLKERDVKERKLMQVNDEYEERLSKARGQIVAVSEDREALKDERHKMVVRLQALMRSHCEEALSLLTANAAGFGGATAARHNNAVWATPAPVTRESFVGISRDLPHDPAPVAEQNRTAGPHPSWDAVHSAHTLEELSSADQRWVRLSTMNSDPVLDGQTAAQSKNMYNTALGTIPTSEYSTSGEDHKLDYPYRSTVTDVVENIQKEPRSDLSPSTSNESFEEQQPLDQDKPGMFTAPSGNLSDEVLRMLQQQNTRQAELSHFVRQLLKKSPASASSEEVANAGDAVHIGSTSPVGHVSVDDDAVISPVRGPVSEKDSEVNPKDSRRSLAENGQSTSGTSEHNRQMAFRKSAATPLKHQKPSKLPVPHTPPNKDRPTVKGSPVLTPDQVGQLARLIQMYQKDNKDDELPSPQKMFQYMRDVQNRSNGADDKTGQRHLHGLPKTTYETNHPRPSRRESRVKRKLEVNAPASKSSRESVSSSRLIDDSSKEVTQKSFGQEEPRRASRAPLTSDSELSLPRRQEHKASKSRNSAVKPQKRSSTKAWK